MNRAKVSDLGAAAYILMHNFDPAGKQNKDVFFWITEKNTAAKLKELKLEYYSSEFHRFDACIMSLKKLEEESIDSKHFRFLTDLGAAAYILMHKYKLLGRKGKAFYFEIEADENKFDKLHLEYVKKNNVYKEFDSCLMAIKQMGEYLSD